MQILANSNRRGTEVHRWGVEASQTGELRVREERDRGGLEANNTLFVVQVSEPVRCVCGTRCLRFYVANVAARPTISKLWNVRMCYWVGLGRSTFLKRLVASR